MRGETRLAGAAETPFGLLGRTLGHSWSPRIHAELGSVPYALHELEPEQLRDFVLGGGWHGLNVTIPYKRDVIPMVDVLGPAARRLGAVNTLVRRDDGTILGDNTDLAGFAWMLDRFCRRSLGADGAERVLEGREALVLGSGGAGSAVRAALEDAGARVSVISRGGDAYGTLAERHGQAVLVVNATPVGMYPDCPASPVDEGTLAGLHGLRGVLDVVYNPRRTGICLAAERLGLPSESGLGMLVAQARRSSELFQGVALADSLVERIERDILGETQNVVLIGMPGAGKTSTGKRLARMLGRPFVDMDDACALAAGMPVASYIRAHGEGAFRELETRALARYCKESGLVVACGGGVVTRPGNYGLLHENGTIVMLDRPLGQLPTHGRPVSQKRGVEALAAERMGLYRTWADVVVRCTGSAEGDAVAARRLLAL